MKGKDILKDSLCPEVDGLVAIGRVLTGDDHGSDRVVVVDDGFGEEAREFNQAGVQKKIKKNHIFRHLSRTKNRNQPMIVCI